ncbi:MAG: hypothetical protein N3D10_01295 [Candidatus Micrarchaeota archaeon]|nr:hypothetical protein [Candidatus Micrarchaeota archaeon]
MSKGQLAIEFLVVIALFLFLLTPIFLYVQLNLQGQNSLAFQSKNFESFSRLAQAIKAVASAGPTSAMQIKLFFPINSKLGLKNKEIFLSYLADDGRTITHLHSSDFEIYFLLPSEQLASDYVLELPAGYYYVTIECSEFGKVKIKIN